MPKTLRIFISSPGDVKPERRRAQLIIGKLAKTYARFFAIEPVLWEVEPMLASGSFQDQIVPPSETDILVLILWSRLGTPLPASTATREYRGIDGRSPVTGTEWEFESALAAYQQKGAPHLLAYKKKAPPKAEYKSAADLQELAHQLQKLEAFWRAHFLDKGEFKAAYGSFTDLDDFESRLENDLRKLIEQRIAAERTTEQGTQCPIWLVGSPFRGLESYQFEHAPIFFGRSAMTKAAVEQLTGNAESGRAFLLILGASGSGKSSLAQAGVVPALIARGIVPQVGLWRRAVMRPSGHADGPFVALAQALTAEKTALPELLSSGQTIAALAGHLRTAAESPIFPIEAVLNQIAEAAKAKGEILKIETARLMLVVDQLEELFTASNIGADDRRTFIKCLDGLAKSGKVYVLATMRSDLWHHASETGQLVDMAAGLGRLDLKSAAQDEMLEMIRQPAQAAGIEFETDPARGIKLDSTLAFEAASEPGALPLLSFLMDELYKKDTQAGSSSTLTFGSMKSVGGLKGAIRNRANTTFETLPSEVQAALPKVLWELVTVSSAEAEPTAQPAAMTRFPEGSPERRLVDALLIPQVRLLVAEGDGNDDGAQVRLAHEALITHWERAKQIITQQRDDYRTRSVTRDALKEWSTATQKKRGYLLRDPQLANAVDLASRRSAAFETTTLAFIAESRNAATRRRNAISASLGVGLIIALGLASLAYWQWRIAAGQRQIAEEQRTYADQQRKVADEQRLNAERQQKLAEGQRDKAVRTQALFLTELSRLKREASAATLPTLLALEAQALRAQSIFLADLSTQKLETGDAITATLLALEALPNAENTRPYVPESRFALDQAWRSLRESMPVELRVLKGHTDSVNGAVFVRDGARVLTWSPTSGRLWDVKTGASLTTIKSLGSAILQGALSADGALIILLLEDKTVRAWDISTGRQLKSVKLKVGESDTAMLSPNGTRIVSYSQATSQLSFLDTTTGNVVHASLITFGDQIGRPKLTYAAFDNDGSRVITQFRTSLDTARFQRDDILIWKTETGIQESEDTKDRTEISRGKFSSDGQRIISWWSKVASIRNVSSGKEIGLLRGHTDEVTSAAFSPNDSLVVTTSKDKTARLWGPTPPQLPYQSDLPILSVRPIIWNSDPMSSDRKRVAEIIEDRGNLFGLATTYVELLDAETNKSISKMAFGGQGDPDYNISKSFSPDSKRLLILSSSDPVLWDAITGKFIASFPTGRVSLAGFSPDGSRIVTVTGKIARLWDTASGEPVGEILKGHYGEILTVAFTADGKYVATNDSDGTARVWEVETGKIVAMQEKLSFYDLPFLTNTQDLISHAMKTTPRCLSLEQRKEFSLPVEPPSWCIEMEKYPYDMAEWKEWLKFHRADLNPPLPNSLEWHSWLRTRQTGTAPATLNQK